MSIRNGARVVPLAAAVNIASEAAISNAQGMCPDKDNRAGIRVTALMVWGVVMRCNHSSSCDP